MEETLYFAYGSNINLDQMAYRCPDAVPLTPVTLRGYALTFQGGGVANIIPQEGSSVPGLLWKLTPECVESLDHYEGYPRLYTRESVVVVDKSNTGHRVMVYVMNERFREPMLPSKHYFKGILDGYHQNGMPTRPLYQALQNTREDVEKRFESERPFYQVHLDHLKKGKPPKNPNRGR